MRTRKKPNRLLAGVINVIGKIKDGCCKIGLHNRVHQVEDGKYLLKADFMTHGGIKVCKNCNQVAMYTLPGRDPKQVKRTWRSPHRYNNWVKQNKNYQPS